MDDTSIAKLIINRIRELRSGGFGELEFTRKVESEVDVAGPIDEKVLLLSELSNELQRRNRFEEAEQAIKAVIAFGPNRPDGWIRLALHHLYYTGDLAESWDDINRAIENASWMGIS